MKLHEKPPSPELYTITNEIATVTIPVLHFRDFDLTTHEDVLFKVYRDHGWLKAVAQISPEERQTIGIPEELVFLYLDHVVVNANNMEEETLDIIKDIILELEVQDLV
jgi:hypothetical protein